MNILITARKTTVKDSFRDKIEKKLEKFDRFFGDEAKAVVVVTNERDRDTVEVTITTNGMIFRSEKTTQDRTDSLDAVCNVLFKQIVKNKSKLINRVREKAFENIDVADLPTELEHEFNIAKQKKFPVHAMSIDEAILQMNMLGHQFFVFENGETGKINVVYSRHDESYGLIEPVQ
ncbi:MAG: ribosome hibernation-promoting factor, HPF/YfiA family [Candidatus Fimivivens sp.]